MTPSHSFGDFRFKTYAPIAFRYFRELFNIKPADFLVLILPSLLTSSSEVDLHRAVARTVECRRLRLHLLRLLG